MPFTAEAAKIPEGTLVIAGALKILGIAGVIGVESAVTDKTKRILLDPPRSTRSRSASPAS